MYTRVYAREIPLLLEQLADLPEMRRLADIDMHCGINYAAYPVYRNAKGPYSRLTHSMGVAKIVWHFTHDLKQAVAGLLHDISTPAFAHTIDFLHGDHADQEFTENETRSMIMQSCNIMHLLKQHELDIDEVCDYHIYPIADNDTPMLSADRLEYTLGNAYTVYHLDMEALRELYDDLYIARNESDIPELAFHSLAKAQKFTEISLRNSILFSSDGDRFSMQFLADLIGRALQSNAIVPQDLYTTESRVIAKLQQNAELVRLWKRHTETSEVKTSPVKIPDRYCVNITSKKLYINPLVQTEQGTKRIGELDAKLKNEMNSFLNTSFDKWLY